MLTLSACAAAPAVGVVEEEEPVGPTSRVLSGGQAAGAARTHTSNLARWWEHFGDARLTGLVGDALAANADLAATRAALAQARATRDTQEAALWPTVGGSVGAGRTRSAGVASTPLYKLGFDASWELDLFGGHRATLRAAEADLIAADLTLAQARVSLAAEVASNYIQWRSLQARLALTRETLAAQRDTEQIARWRLQAGLVSSLDVEQATAAAEQTAAQVPALADSLAQAVTSLAVLTGREPSVFSALPAEPGGLPTADERLAQSVTANTLQQRADLRAAEARVRAALARVDAAEAARWPGFTLSGSVGLQALTLGALSSQPAIASSLLATVAGSLFDGGAARAQVRAQQAGVDAARAQYRSAALTALKEVEDALHTLRADAERQASLARAVEAAQAADQLARQRYTAGLIDFRTVLDTQRSLLTLRDALETVRAARAADLVRLYKALGGGWDAASS